MNINWDDDNDETSISNTSTMFGKLLSSILCYFNTIKFVVGLGSSFSDFWLSFSCTSVKQQGNLSFYICWISKWVSG